MCSNTPLLHNLGACVFVLKPMNCPPLCHGYVRHYSVVPATVCYPMQRARVHLWRCNLWVYSTASVVLCSQLFALIVFALRRNFHEDAQYPAPLENKTRRRIAVGECTHRVPPRTGGTPSTLEKNTGTIYRPSLNHKATRNATGQITTFLHRHSAGRAKRSSSQEALTGDSPQQHHGLPGVLP